MSSLVVNTNESAINAFNNLNSTDSAMTKAFTKATGIPVKLDDNSTGPLLTQIEASRNNPNWGLLWVVGHRVRRA